MIKISRLFIPYIIIILIAGFNINFLLCFLWIMMHEFFHFLCAKKVGIEDMNIKFIPMGMVLQSESLDYISTRQDMIIALAGPLSNIALAVLFYLISLFYSNDIITLSLRTNIALGVFNLIPAFPLDGARVLRDILSTKTIYKRANRITIKISIVIGTLLLGYFIFLIFFKIFNVNLGLLSLFIIYISSKEKERIAYVIMGDVVKKKIRFLKNKYIENKSISIYFKNDLIKALSILDKNKYNIFTVLDDDMKVIDIIYEQDIIQALKIYGNITIEEYINIKKT